MQEGLAQAGLVVAKLRLGDGEVLPDAVAFGAVAAGQAFRAFSTARGPWWSRESAGLARDGTFEVDGRQLCGEIIRKTGKS